MADLNKPTLRLWHKLALAVLALIIVFKVGIGFDLYRHSTPSSFSLAATKIIPYPAAIVGYQAVAYHDYWQQVGFVKKTAESNKQPIDDKAVHQSVLSDRIDTMLFRRAARQMNIHVSQSDIEATYNSYISTLAPENEIADTLQRIHGMTVADYKQVLRDVIIRQRVTDRLKSTNLLKKGQASHILIAVPADADEKTQADLKKHAEDVLAQAKSYQDFAELAKQQSEDKGSRDQGGDVGEFVSGQIDPDFEAAVWQGTPGQIIPDLVKTKWGWHIIKVVENTGQYKNVDDWLAAERSHTRIWRLIRA